MVRLSDKWLVLNSNYTDFQTISDGEENRWESIRAKSDTNYNPTASVTNEKFFENIA